MSLRIVRTICERLLAVARIHIVMRRGDEYSVRTCRVIFETRDTEEIIALAPYSCLTKCKPASTSFLVLWRMGRYFRTKYYGTKYIGM